MQGSSHAAISGEEFRSVVDILGHRRSSLLHNSLNRNRFKDKIMQPFKVLQRPLRV
ncbi:hypothetical protein GR223_20680 [Rhizobium leguminosarum]|uniref:Uncharacterized protein n=1 Tax=Rhizobium ruizarguesonis TaxID=2081791 RepID=A0AAE4YW32_9HYPH|nr:hypothetical protein [Rhizobium ruizarguesonis]NEH64097.1 hypothetical protein [Rhizobium ruizarguesonis]NEH85969.1 hypothetical protein [Rhizobium ruizarguesonis]NEI14667.1 hypothetical protein [Rhizobium ruizarguesonis]NEI18233.1 hypothetical protein [Rhizobium ruizarguesonis]